MRTCESCVFYNETTGTCGPYGMPAEAARADAILCGPDGEEWDPASPILPRWGWVIVVALATFVAYMNAAPILAWWQWVTA